MCVYDWYITDSHSEFQHSRPELRSQLRHGGQTNYFWPITRLIGSIVNCTLRMLKIAVSSSYLGSGGGE